MNSASVSSQMTSGAPHNAGCRAFELRQVSRCYRLGSTEIHALRDIDLAIEAGELLAIWGPSGSGKSTLLNLLGLIDAADSGELAFDGEPVARLTEQAKTTLRSRKIGFIFQSFNLIPVMSALENVMLPLLLQSLPPLEAKSRALHWLERVGLQAFTGARPDLLSGGQRQRVAIARALVTEPLVVIADEPTANLDSMNSKAVIDLIIDLNRSSGVTCIFSTHDPRLLERIPRRLLMTDGRIVEDASDRSSERHAR